MSKRRRKFLNRATVAALSASMVAPAVTPAIQVFAEEVSVRDLIANTHIGKTTPSDAEEEKKNTDVAGDEIPDITFGNEDKATPSDAKQDKNEIGDLEISKNEALKAPAKQQSRSYPVFGTTAFWNWYNDLFNAMYDEDGDTDAAREAFDEEMSAWYESVAVDRSTDSDADKEYPAFDTSMDPETSDFWKWFFDEAVTFSNDGTMASFNNSAILDWIRNSSYEDVMAFLENFNMLRQVSPMSVAGDLWPQDYGAGGDLYSDGAGTEENPYKINSVADLRLMAVTIAQGQHADAYYLLEDGTYDLNGSWIPIGFPANDGQKAVAFTGHFAAEEGAHIANLGFNANSTLGITSEMSQKIKAQESVGFFGELGAGASVTGLYIDTDGNTLEGTDYAGILAGRAVDATIKECTVRGIVTGTGYVGGVVGFAESSRTQASVRNTLIEDCNADKAYVYITNANNDSGELIDGHGAVGGIVGYAVNTSIVDTEVSTDTGSGQHIYGNGAYVGGIVGVLENSDVYNSYVTDGQVGSNNAYSVGGLVGGYNGGQIKVGRFAGDVVEPSSGYNYSACFIGSRVGGAGFTYGEDGNIAYLFADTKAKADTGICGSRVEDDGIFGHNAHIGYWHAGDIYYSTVSGGSVNNSDDYFYEELERGILNVKNDNEENTDTINHFTADSQGRPTRGYLVTITDPTVDGTKAAEITAYINGTYKPHVTSENLGAFAPGDVVYIQFNDLHDGTGYFQMDETIPDNPYYNYYEKDVFNVYEEDSVQKGITKGAGYYITMPESDITIGATYKRVSQSVTNNPDNIVFEITQVRTGARENPNIEWRVTAYNGNKDVDPSAQIITDAKGNEWNNRLIARENADGTTWKDDDAFFWLGSLVNGSENKQFNLSWTTSNDNNSDVISNPTAGDGQVLDETAYFTINLQDSAITDKIEELEQIQKDGGYRNSMTTSTPTWFHSLITSTARVEDSDDKDNPPKGYTNINVKLNVQDNTNVSVQGVALSRNDITYDVVRTLSGSRANPTVTYSVTGGDDGTQADLTATFNPDYFSNNAVDWYLSEDKGNFEADKNVGVAQDKNTQDDGTINVAVTGTGDKAYYNATVTLKGITQNSCDNSSISQWVEAQDTAYTDQMKKVPSENGYTYTKYVKVTADDSVNNSVTDTCKVTVNFKTVDNTEIMPTAVTIDNKSNIHNYNIRYVFSGDSSSQITARTITMDDAAVTRLTNGVGEDLNATVSPEYADTDEFKPYDNGVVWSLTNPDTGSNLDPYDVLNIDAQTGQITVRGYNGDTSGNGYSPWIQSLIAEGKLDGTTVTVRALARSTRDESLVDYKDINVTFTANTMAPGVEDMLTFDVVLTKDVATSLSDTSVQEKETWSGTDAQQISATATGTSEAPAFTVYDMEGEVSTGILNLRDSLTRAISTNKYVSVNTGAQWIQNVINNRESGNSDSEALMIKAQTANGTSVAEIPVTVNFRYDGTDMTAAEVTELPEGYEATPDLIGSSTPAETYDTSKGDVTDRQITLDVVATQGNYSVGNPETRKWSFGIVKLDNTTYSSQGVKENDAVYELSGDLAQYARVDANGYLVPTRGNWNSVIDAGQTRGSVSGIVTAKKDVDGKVTSDSYKVTINFRYDKTVLESHEETFDVVYTQDSQTNAVNSHWTGDDYIQLNATIVDEGGQNVTPTWESSDPDIVTVDADGRVYVNKDTWIKEIIDNAQTYGQDVPHSGTREVTVTAKHPTTGATADTCLITVNFRYDQVMMDSHEEVYDIVLTQTSRTNNPSVKWSGNEVRKLNANVYVKPGQTNNPVWASEDAGIVTVDEAGNIAPVIDAAWMQQIVAEGKYEGRKVVAVNATDSTGAVKDSCNVIINFKYENVVMDENAKTMDVTLTASGVDTNPTYTITGTKAAVNAVLHSINPDETKVVYSSNNSGLLGVDGSGNVSVTLPGTLTLNADGTLSIKDPTNNKNSVKTELANNASAFLKEAMKHEYTDANKYVSSTTAVITAASEDGRMADQCNVTIKLKYIDNTYHRSSGGGGGGGGSSSGGGGGSSSSGTTPGSSTSSTSYNLPSYVLKGGTWTQNALGQWFYSNGRTFTDEWAAVQNPYADASKGQPSFDWFHFGEDSVMDTGWYTDDAGDTYYLHTVPDNTLGHMYTGWQWIDDNGDGMAECYYFEPESNGYRGRLYKSTTTPDGYTVNEKGQWTQNGIVITKDVTEPAPTWRQDAAGKWFYSNGHEYKNEWALVDKPYADAAAGQPAQSWFHFGADGAMDTGWFTDSNGYTYYLNPAKDNTQGRMLTGWQWIDKDGDGMAECYYFSEDADHVLGHLYKNTKTPDGYTVNSQGQWTENGSVVTKKL